MTKDKERKCEKEGCNKPAIDCSEFCYDHRFRWYSDRITW